MAGRVGRLMEPLRKWGPGHCMQMFARWLRRHVWDGADLLLFRFSTEHGRLESRIKPPREAEMRFATEDEAQELADFSPFMTLSGVREHFARGERCFIARMDGRIVYQAWAAPGSCYVWLLDKRLSVGPRAVYVYNTFTDPAYRDRRLMPASVAQVKQVYRERGFTHGYTVVDLKAGLALKAYCRLLGRGRAVLVRYRRRLCWRRYRCERLTFEQVVERFDRGGQAP